MSLPTAIPSLGYIVYIDEAGDDGLRKIKSGDEGGSSQYMVMAAVLIKAEREKEVLPWTKAIVSRLDQHQLTHLHFRTLKDEKKGDYGVCTPSQSQVGTRLKRR